MRIVKRDEWRGNNDEGIEGSDLILTTMITDLLLANQMVSYQ